MVQYDGGILSPKGWKYPPQMILGNHEFNAFIWGLVAMGFLSVVLAWRTSIYKLVCCIKQENVKGDEDDRSKKRDCWKVTLGMTFLMGLLGAILASIVVTQATVLPDKFLYVKKENNITFYKVRHTYF